MPTTKKWSSLRGRRPADALWMLGIGYTAANGVVDDPTRYLVEEGSS